jgi:iron complex outermembrane recepter protein
MSVPLLLALAAAQAPAGRDTLAADTVRLGTLDVTVSRSGAARARVPAAIGTLDSADLRRGRVLAGLDEALSRIPGVVVTNRYNPSLDQRLVIRGAGSRANFGVRGIRVLIDGLPQTLPDGQSQLTNLDLGLVSRVEALVGSASALHGNAAGGVVAFVTETPTGPFARLRTGAGAFGTSRVSLATGSARGAFTGLLGISRLDADGFRQHSRTRTTQVTATGTAVLSPGWMARARWFGAWSPVAENPGALTAAELAARRDSAAAANILRGADKRVTQHQAGITLSHAGAGGRRLEFTVFGLVRDLENPLAAAPPPPVTARSGTWVGIDRVAGGARVEGEWPLGTHAHVGVGADLQAMRDDRVNRRAEAGRPTATLLIDQRETVTELGPFLSLRVAPLPALLLRGTVRYDRLSFRTRDRLAAGGTDQGGARTLDAASGSVGASVTRAAWTAWASAGSAFETPTTTELANRPDGQRGFNEALGPQRATTLEAGIRRGGPAAGVSLVAYRSTVGNAIVQAREANGRAYFENAGRLRHQGVEAGIDLRLAPWLRGAGSYSLTASRFVEYRPRTGARVDTLDGRRVPAVPRHSARLALMAGRGAWSVEVEQQLASSQAADDANTVIVDGWGAGVTTVRVAARVAAGAGGLTLAPFAAVHNLFDRRYVGSVNVNGFGGRFLEPAPGRWAFLGLEVGWRPRS